MSSPATERLRLAPAPGALAFVQELMNTWPAGGYVPDLLADPAEARLWLTAVGQDPGAAAPGELGAVRAVRDELRLLAASRGGSSSPVSADRVPASARILVGGNGAVSLEPAGHGAAGVASAAWLAVALAQQPGRTPDVGQWSRLKVCGNAECGSTFYDRSRNNSGVWHDVRTCGNAANLRAFRERRRAAAGPDS